MFAVMLALVFFADDRPIASVNLEFNKGTTTPQHLDLVDPTIGVAALAMAVIALQFDIQHLTRLFALNL